MRRIVLLCLLPVFILLTNGCGSKATNTQPAFVNKTAVFVAIDDISNLGRAEQKELQRVIHWMDRDILKRLEKNGFETSLLLDMKNYTSMLGNLLIINVMYFNPGKIANSSKDTIGTGSSTLELNYKLLDARGALLTEWQDGADSIRGGTYCARTLNRRCLEKITSLRKKLLSVK